jgi:hypothetical protein
MSHPESTPGINSELNRSGKALAVVGRRMLDVFIQDPGETSRLVLAV